MIRTLHNGVSGVSAQMRNIDVTAHNLSNINTAGFKKEALNFSELMQQKMASQGLSVHDQGKPTTQGGGAYVSGTKTRHTQGSANYTGRELDLALEGRGFFPVTRADGEVFFTRNGSFKIDAQGRLVTDQGYVLIDDELPEDRRGLSIDETGMISYEDDEGEIQEWGQIEIALFARPAELRSVGANLFAATEASGEPEYVYPEADIARVAQGYLESSNVDMAEEVQYLIESQRVFQLNTRSITTADQMWGIANNLQR